MVPAVPSSVWTCFCASLQRECHLAQGDPLSCAVPLSLFMPVLWFAQSNAHPGGCRAEPPPAEFTPLGALWRAPCPEEGGSCPGAALRAPPGGEPRPEPSRGGLRRAEPGPVEVRPCCCGSSRLGARPRQAAGRPAEKSGAGEEAVAERRRRERERLLF